MKIVLIVKLLFVNCAVFFSFLFWVIKKLEKDSENPYNPILNL